MALCRIAAVVACCMAISVLCIQPSNADSYDSDAATRALFEAVASQDIPALQQALAAGARIDEHGADYNRGGQSPLMMASLGGYVRSLEWLLHHGADPTIAEKDGYTPLHGAAFQGQPEAARVLLADPRVPNEMHADGYLPLHRACWGQQPRHAETVRAFLQGGPHPHDVAARDGATPMDFARKSGNAATIAVLEAAAKGDLGPVPSSSRRKVKKDKTKTRVKEQQVEL